MYLYEILNFILEYYNRDLKSVTIPPPYINGQVIPNKFNCLISLQEKNKDKKSKKKKKGKEIL
jgi:hypothetical protein